MSNKFNKGDKVFVINWGNQYSKIGGGNGVFFECPLYSSTDFFWKYTYEPNLTLKGTVNKREPKKLKERIPEFKNYKYEVVDWKYHPKAGEISTDWRTPEKPDAEVWYFTKLPIYLIKSENGCYIEIGEEGLSFLTSEQYKQKEFDALKEFHKGKWTIGMREKVKKEFPENLLGKVYDKNDNVLFGSDYVKGKVIYYYVPAEFTVNNIPFIVWTTIEYDGEGNSNLSKDAELMHFHELKEKFTENEFSY